MGISLKIEINSPLTTEDRDLLSGVAVMTLAIVNRELAQQHFPETFPPDEKADQAEHEPCGMEAGDGTVCVSQVGHRGRHRFRRLAVGMTNGLPN